MKRTWMPAAGVVLLQSFGGVAVADDWEHYANSGFQYCDAVMLGQHWNETVDDAKATIGRKVSLGNTYLVDHALRDARTQNRRCSFDDTGYSYEDAEALAQWWEVSTSEAKAALAEKVSMGWRELADEAIAEAHSG